MAKAKARSGKSKTSGGHRKKHGARPGLTICPILGQMTYKPLQGPAGYPGSATVSDLGFLGRPKSRHKSHALNPIYTGSMAFPEANLRPVMLNGRIEWQPIQHDEHRKAASAERRESRKQRKLSKEKIARRIKNRAHRLMLEDPELSLNEAVTKAAIQVRSLVSQLPQY